MRAILLAVPLALLLGLLAAASCDSSEPDACTPGQSVACTGVGGCAGGQVCTAEGSGYGPCDCTPEDAGPDDAEPDDAGPDDSGPDDAEADDASLPIEGAVHVAWTLRRGITDLACADVPGEDGVSVLLTPTGPGAPVEGVFDCEDGAGDVGDLPFGAHTISVSLLDSAGLALGSAAPATVTLAAEPCARLLSGDCVRDVEVTIQVD